LSTPWAGFSRPRRWQCDSMRSLPIIVIIAGGKPRPYVR
jgi:hypothetical protein